MLDVPRDFIQPTFSRVLPHLVSLDIFPVPLVYWESPSLIIHSLIHKLKIDQEQLQCIHHSNNTPFQTPFSALDFDFIVQSFSFIHNVLIDYITHVVVLTLL